MPHHRRPRPPHDFWARGPHHEEDWRAMFERFLGQPPEEHWMFGGRRFRPWLLGEAVFNPFVAMALSRGGGLLPLYVMHLLAAAPRYGNELMSQIEERTRGAWGTNPGAIYPLLNELEAHGLVRGEWDDPRRRTVRRYTLTEKGRDELERLKAVMRPKLRDGIEVLQDILDEIEDDAEPDEDDHERP